MEYNVEIFVVVVKGIVTTALKEGKFIFSTVNDRISFRNNSDINNFTKKTLK